VTERGPQTPGTVFTHLGAADDLRICALDSRNPFNPADDRVVDIALHLDADDAMGDAVRVAARSEAVSPS
jgi:hypothetical protein